MKEFFGLLYLAVLLTLFLSWGTNIYYFATQDFEEPYKAEILRGVGIPVFPLGVVLAWVDL